MARSFSSLTKELYNPKAFFTHAALLDQGCPHCPKFPTAASRRSLGRVSVPVWLIVLSDQLLIIALVGLYPTNQLISYRPLQEREARRSPTFIRRSYAVLANLSTGCPPLLGTFRYITHPFATRHQGCPHAAVRLACVKHAASVQSEPGSNSSVQSLAFAFQGHISATSRSQNTDKVLLPKSLLSSANVCLLLPLNKRPHLSSVSFFKDRFALHYTSTINKAFCLSTAEKRNYALLFTTCQELF